MTTDVGGNSEVVCRPELGTIVPFGDRSALCSALASALSKTWDRDIIVAYAHNNSWEERVTTLISEFGRLVRSAPVASVRLEAGKGGRQ